MNDDGTRTAAGGRHVPSTIGAPAPHGGGPLRTAGVPLDQARGAVILLHGRGGSAEDILELGLAAAPAAAPLALLAPQASDGSWYPFGFMTEIRKNQPGLDSALGTIDALVASVTAAGIPADRIAFVGFSQGACLTSEYVARNARRWGAVAALSGGVIGPAGTPRDHAGSLDGTPTLFGCSDVDAHIPEARVRESAALYERLGATVDLRIYPGMGHTVNDDELRWLRSALTTIAAG